MLIVAHKGREREVVDIFRKWDLDAVVIGRVREGSNMRVIHNNEIVADIPVSALTDEAPLYERPMKSMDNGDGKDEGVSVGGGLDIIQPAPPTAPIFQENSLESKNETSFDSRLQTPDSRLNESLLRLVSAPNIASKEWVYRQYDHMVRTNTIVMPGADAAVVRIKETRRALAMCLDGNGRYCAANPREGARLIVAEAARNVVCTGARPIAITNCLNFASPERPEVMWSFSEVIDGIAEACRALGTPVVSGNVSFYNETEGRGILPTPVIGMVGLIEDVRRVVQHGFKAPGDIIALLGTTGDDLSISEYASIIEGRTTDEMIREGRVPALDLEREKSVQETCLRAAMSGLLRSAHDCSDGGLSVALAECCFSSLNREAIGAEVDLAGETLSLEAQLFSESPSRIIVSFDERALGQMEEIAASTDCPLTILGHTGGDHLSIKADGEDVVHLPVTELEAAWRTSLATKLRAEVVTLP
jgi:phosphoribosylformylglycinamidine synthase